MESYDAYRDDRMPGERGFPAGPLGYVRDGPLAKGFSHDDGSIPIAIGFCPWCGANARRTTQVRGLFDCPECPSIPWMDDRVGKQPVSAEDFFSSGGDV